MTNSKFIKGIVLTGFLSLLILFLLYRTGKLDPAESPPKSQINPDTANEAIIDTHAINSAAADSMEMLIMSSSKSLILTEDKTELKQRTK